ncbi:MAG: TAXI family TRAP transporter solute-binding subunit [Bacillota bacterium]
MFKTKKFSMLLVFAGVLLLIIGCGGNQVDKASSGVGQGGVEKKSYSTQSIVFGTGTMGGFYNVMGSGIAGLIEKELPGVRATAQVTSASQENNKRVSSGEMQFGFSTADAAYYAYNGGREFQEKYPGVRHVISSNFQQIHVIVPANSRIKSVSDLKGKKVTVSKGQTFTVIFPAVLEAYGLSMNDVQAAQVAAADTVGPVRDGVADAAFVVTAAPTSYIQDLALTKAVRFISLDKDKIDSILAKHPYWVPATIPPNTYKGLDYPVPNFGLVNTIIANKDLDPNLVYDITKLLVEKNSELQSVHPDAKFFTLENAFSGARIPLHPGAEKYYKEKGVTIPPEIASK